MSEVRELTLAEAIAERDQAIQREQIWRDEARRATEKAERAESVAIRLSAQVATMRAEQVAAEAGRMK
jgi:hypothetical protein